MAKLITKMQFKRAVKNIKAHEDDLRGQAMLNKLLNGEVRDFFKEIKSLNPSRESLPLTVGEATGEKDIAGLWKQHFSHIANSVANDGSRNEVLDMLSNVPVPDATVSVTELASIVKHLKSNKAAGHDGVPAEVFKFASPRLLTMLSILLSSCIKYQYLPRQLMYVVLTPILKCKTKDPSEQNNYRPIAVGTAISKLLEQVLHNRLNNYLWTSDRQFGFKPRHGTELAIFALKQTVSYYTSNGSPVYLCFLDAKKAFDRVNHWTLFKKLLDRGTPKYLVNIMKYWYREQEFVIKWGETMSESFHCNNGIRQGGQLSPLLYNIYIDDLNEQLNKANCGCMVGGRSVNALSYADDMVLMAPTLSALRQLIAICEKFAQPHDIIYNTTKTVCMLIKPRCCKINYSTHAVLGNTPLQFVDDFKYLGHIISADCRDEKDVHKQFRRQNAVGNMLVRKFHFAPVAVKIQLFKTYCYPIYCNALWSNPYQYALKRLEVSYSDTFKRLVGVPRWTSSSAVFANNYTDHIKVVFRKAAYSLLKRVEISENGIIRDILRSDAFRSSALYARWEELLRGR
jgi:retron-type reverse transcriptase